MRNRLKVDFAVITILFVAGFLYSGCKKEAPVQAGQSAAISDVQSQQVRELAQESGYTATDKDKDTAAVAEAAARQAAEKMGQVYKETEKAAE